jgi:NADH:ubiquinone reductase (H+-translocating)
VGMAFNSLKMSGFIAWLAWLFIHVLFLIGFRNRLLVLINWAYSFFTLRRGARLITGTAQSPTAYVPRLERLEPQVDLRQPPH